MLLMLMGILYILMILLFLPSTSKNFCKILGTVLCNSMLQVSLCNSGVLSIENNTGFHNLFVININTKVFMI